MGVKRQQGRGDQKDLFDEALKASPRNSVFMAGKKKLEDVFKTVGLPPYTYVKPTYYGEVRADISQPGKHLLIEGPSGIGKTCVAFKVFEELGWAQDKKFIYVSCQDVDAIDKIDAFLNSAGKGETPNPNSSSSTISTCSRSLSAPRSAPP